MLNLRNFFRCGLAMLALGMSNPSLSYGDVLYNSLFGAPDSSLGTFPIGAAGPEGDSFSTLGQNFLLTNVVVQLQGVQDPNSFSLSLYNDNLTTCPTPTTCNGGPLSPLYTIAMVNDNSLSSTFAAGYNFSLAIPQLLSANTRYWIIANSSNASGTLWSYTADTSGVGVANEFNVDAFGVVPNSFEPFQMAILGKTVPEPSPVFPLALAVLGVIALAGRKRLRA